MFESPQPAIPQENNKEKESLFDPRLEGLWDDYDFPGHPPKKASQAEKRLYDKCVEYANTLDHSGHYSALSLAKSSDSRRRQLHNEIAVMVVGKQRSGMQPVQAEHIANFAYEYARGISLQDIEKIQRQREVE